MADDRPRYDSYASMEQSRGPAALSFARQILDTTSAARTSTEDALTVLDIGCGYGHTARELARLCSRVVGVEPSATLVQRALELHPDVANLTFRQSGVLDLTESEVYDLVVLDNVYEHLPDQQQALELIVRAMKPGGVLFLLTPNRLWPIEAHYRLPFLSYLPLPIANRYLRLSGRGENYSDASYAPTARSLGRALGAVGVLDWQFTLPAHADATMQGGPWHYRLGMRVLQRRPELWTISKALLVVAVKRSEGT